MRFLVATWILFRTQLGTTVFTMRTLISLGLVSTPVLGALLFTWLSQGRTSPPVLELAWVMNVQCVVPIVALILGSTVVAEEVDERTITYLLTRPIPRSSILIGRWLAVLLIVTVMLWASGWAVFVIFDRIAADVYEWTQPEEVRRRIVNVVLLGGLAYTTVFAVAGALFRRPIIVGLGYTFAVEGLMANLPGSNQGLTIQYYLKSYLLAGDPELSRRLMHPMSIELVAPDAGLRMIIWITLAALVIGSVVISRRQYVLPA